MRERSGSCPGLRVVRSPHPPRLSRRSLRSRRVAGPRGTRGSRTTLSPAPPAARKSSPLTQAIARHDDADGRALSRLALHFAQPSQKGDALAHAEEAEVARAHPGLTPLLGLEPMAVVRHVDLEGLLVLEERETHLVRGGVLLHVVQRLDGHAIERRFGFARKRPRVVEGLLKRPP